MKDSTSRKESENKIGNIFQSCGVPFYRKEMETNRPLYSYILGTCRWSELIMYFGSFALWALKFKFFVGRLIANKHLPITDNCQKLKQKRYRKKQDESIHTWKTKGDQTKTKNKNKKQTKKDKAKGN